MGVDIDSFITSATVFLGILLSRFPAPRSVTSILSLYANARKQLPCADKERRRELSCAPTLRHFFPVSFQLLATMSEKQYVWSLTVDVERD